MYGRRTYSRSRSSSQFRRIRPTAMRRNASAVSHYRNAYRNRIPGLMQPTVNNELKAIDFNYGLIDADNPFSEISGSTTGGASSLCVNAIRQGTGFYERIGRKVTCRSLQITGVLNASAEVDADSAPDAVTVRMVVVYDRQPNQSMPAFNQIFASHSNMGEVNTSTVFSPLNLTQASRFRILKDKVYNLNPTIPGPVDGAASAMLFREKTVKEYIKLPNLETVYESTVSGETVPGVAQISSGAIYVFMRCSVPAELVDTKAQFSNSNFRLRYDDL